MMNKEFVPYEEALALKVLLNYQESCLGRYLVPDPRDSKDIIFEIWNDENTLYKPIDEIPAPLYQQVFRWFRDIHNMPHSIIVGTNPTTNIAYANNIPAVIEGKTDSVYTTYEEAELECLRKLIEIVKQEQDD